MADINKGSVLQYLDGERKIYERLQKVHSKAKKSATGMALDKLQIELIKNKYALERLNVIYDRIKEL